MTENEKRSLIENQINKAETYVSASALEKIEMYRKGFCKLHFVDGDGLPLCNTKVKITQQSHDFKYGANIFMLDEFENDADSKKYREIFKEYFNLATVPFYWDGLEPEKGKPRFEKNSEKVYRRPAPELCLEYCEENGIDAKLHCLVYDKFIPEWLPVNNEKQMEEYYEKRFSEIADRYCGRLYEVEVINEVLCSYAWHKHTVVSNKRNVVEWAFSAAKKYFPNETLVINENQTFELIKRGYRHPYFLQLENCLLKNVPIDKIGLQFHIFTGANAQTDEQYDKSVKETAYLFNSEIVKKGLDIFSEFNLPLELTEVTVPTLGDTPEDEELQAKALKNLYTVAFANPNVNAVVYWNTVDGYCYSRSADDKTKGYWNENNCKGGLFRHDLTPKKSALMLKKLFGEVWHTYLELTTDENGYVQFKGFYGKYTVENGLFAANFDIKKGNNNVTEIEIL